MATDNQATMKAIQDIAPTVGMAGGPVGGAIGSLVSAGAGIYSATKGKPGGESPVSVYGRGPAVSSSAPLTSGGMRGREFQSGVADIRSTTSPTTSDISTLLKGRRGGNPLISSIVRNRQLQSLGQRMRGIGEVGRKSFAASVGALAQNMGTIRPPSAPEKKGLF